MQPEGLNDIKECGRNSVRRNAISYPKQLILQADKGQISCVWKCWAVGSGALFFFFRGKKKKVGWVGRGRIATTLQQSDSINTQLLPDLVTCWVFEFAPPAPSCGETLLFSLSAFPEIPKQIECCHRWHDSANRFHSISLLKCSLHCHLLQSSEGSLNKAAGCCCFQKFFAF